VVLRPTIIVQLNSRNKVDAFRAGIGETEGVVALGIEDRTFWTLAGIDAFYLSLSRAERWGAHPRAPYAATILRTTIEDQEKGLPKYIISGLVLKDSDPNTAAFGIPILVHGILKCVEEANRLSPGSIRTIGMFEFELAFSETTLIEVARLFGEAFQGASKTGPGSSGG
jgi:hypothetical protein